MWAVLQKAWGIKNGYGFAKETIKAPFKK